jgi:hypothetical protein
MFVLTTKDGEAVFDGRLTQWIACTQKADVRTARRRKKRSPRWRPAAGVERPFDLGEIARAWTSAWPR